MITYLVQVDVKKEYLIEFIKETENNAKNSRLEPGVIGFDFFQQADDEGHFVLIETYHSSEDQLKHRDTAHYQNWRTNVEKMMAAPRKGIKLNPLMVEK